MFFGDILVAFVEWCVIKTTSEKYSGLMDSRGGNLRNFLVNLLNFRNRVMLIYTKLTPPEFKVSDLTKNGLNLHYFSKKARLAGICNRLAPRIRKNV